MNISLLHKNKLFFNKFFIIITVLRHGADSALGVSCFADNSSMPDEKEMCLLPL